MTLTLQKSRESESGVIERRDSSAGLQRTQRPVEKAGRGPDFRGRAGTSNPRDQTLGLEPSGSNSLRARGVMVRGEAWAAASPTGVGAYLNV